MSTPNDSERFPTTSTTLVDALMRGADRDAKLAAELLARAYWRPIHKYIRLRWRADSERADDLTQSFFEQIVGSDRLSGFAPERAKLRTYIRRCLDNFVIDNERRRRARKRGGDAQRISLDEEVTASGEHDPETLFHREWVRRLLELSRIELAAELTAKNKTEHLRVFEAFHDTDPPPSYQELAASLDITATDVGNRLAYARRAYRRIVVTLVTQLTATPEECELELDGLAGAL